MNLPFTQAIQQLTALRDANPALRYGRHCIRPISGDGQSFGTGAWPGGVVALSRILYDTEALVVANTSPNGPWDGYVIVDRDINLPGRHSALCGRPGRPACPSASRRTSPLPSQTAAPVPGR